MTTEAPAPSAPAFDVAELEESLRTRIWENFKGGNLGSLPVVVGLTFIVILFGFTAQNFFTAVNFNNIIVQMAGVTMLAYGVVFVLLLGEIDLSIAFLSGIVGVACAKLQEPGTNHHLPGIWPIVIALLIGIAIGAFQGSFVALIGVPSFVVTLAGLLAWQGFVQREIGAAGPIIIQNHWINDTASYFFSKGVGWVIWALITIPVFAQTTGQVVKIDEPAGTITIKDANGQSAAYKPKDGLLFNAVKEGDNVAFTASDENGQKVITKLEKR